MYLPFAQITEYYSEQALRDASNDAFKQHWMTYHMCSKSFIHCSNFLWILQFSFCVFISFKLKSLDQMYFFKDMRNIN